MILGRRLRGPRRGISLLEVLVALAIFVMALVAISQIIQMSARHARELELEARAVQLCKSQLDKVASGILPLQGTSDDSLSEDPDFTCSIESEQRSEVNGLWQVRVSVRYTGPGTAKVECNLTQLVFDPSQRGSNLDALQNQNSSSQGSSGGTSGGSGGTGTGGQGGAAGGAQGGAAAGGMGGSGASGARQGGAAGGSGMGAAR